ncbi:hypothetical protein [Mycolicibacterium mucogenicum]|uniref:Uncharacterized protein n=1 Tax=Mycolicibacterium mucogenicum DSM 44124 TaxID=1226753 RepID=A0A8H2PI92_MYCMU|nr:hypothetical protein [Mycolicibacterium mucogenicum]KAB7760703.1 hypothetical protein MMUC44124_05405 [Mycolicibacterium mucogenicum DSM 44124]QPG67989.1 hypothetical protein C1S78_021125 [Mycolicibacterium mucogenicum DSM 44124]
MSTAAADDYEASEQAAAWIADATRQFAGLGADDTETDDGWTRTMAGLGQLRSAITQRISLLPRQGKPINTTSSGVVVSHIALAKLLTWSLAEPAAQYGAAIADVEVHVQAQRLTAVHIHLIGVGADERERTYLQDGDALRRETAAVVHTAIGDNTAEITVSWDDLFVTP